jgi:hypothetical protein
MVETTTNEANLDSAIKSFVTNIDASVTSIDMAMLMIIAQFEVRKERFESYLNTYGTPHKNEKGETVYELESGRTVEADKLVEDLDRAAISCGAVPEDLFVALVSRYDAYLGRLLRSLFLLKPELLSDSEKRFTFQELVKFGSIEKAKEHLLEKEVEAVLRKSHSDHFDWMENRFKIELRKNLPSWSTFVELTERRNLFVHCDGVVSSQYLDVCGTHNVALGADLKIGDRLSVSRKYFRTAYRCLFEIGVKLGQVLWRKLRPDQIGNADSNIADITYKLLNKNHNHLACNLLDFACSLPRFSSEENRRIFVINRAQAYKWRGDQGKCEDILKKEDWSACGFKFALSNAVLFGQFEKASRLMKNIGKDGEIGEHGYHTWPLFKEFRKSSEFLSSYNEVFGKPYVEVQKAPKPENYSKGS